LGVVADSDEEVDLGLAKAVAPVGWAVADWVAAGWGLAPDPWRTAK